MSYWSKKINDELIKNNQLTNRLINGSTSQNGEITKQPLNTLNFKQLFDGPVMGFSVYDGKHYIMDEHGTIQVYNDVTVDDEPIETGTTLNNSEGQGAEHFEVTSQGVVVSRNNDDGTCELLYAPDIYSEFTTTYTSPEDTEIHSFSSTFGLKVHDNGQHTIVFVGVYGRGKSEKDLLLSTDGGQTYTVVNKSRVIEPIPYNSHWHDVEIDPYHGFLWASQGDNEASSQIIFSRDLGESWETLEDTEQPTSITAFPNRVVFGRDSKTAGLDSVVKPKLLTDEMSFQPHFELQDVHGTEYYAHSPVKRGSEGYLAFSIFPERNPAMIWGTGDFGETWYGVHMGDVSAGVAGGHIDRLAGIDEEHIFGLGSHWGGGLNYIYYSKKVEWQ